MATATHSHTVQLIRGSGDAICLKIITPLRRAFDRAERGAIGRQQPSRMSTASNSGPSKDRVQRFINKTSSRVPRKNVSPSQSSSGHLLSGHQPPPRLLTARSMPDLTAADDNHSTTDHTHRYENDNGTDGKTNDGVEASPVDDYRDRVLYELTNQLRPSSGVTQPPLDASSSAQPVDSDGTSQGVADTVSADHSIRQRRPAPPPRGTSLSSRLHAPTPAVSSLASRAKSAGSELKELLAVSGHGETSSRTGHEQLSVSNSPSAVTRSTISGEHVILPSQLKKLQRSPADEQASKHDKVHDTTIIESVVKRNGHSSDQNSHHAIVEHRSLVPKRPAPPPPPSTKLTASPTTNGEVNFLVMAEQARKQYILSKLAKETLQAANNATGAEKSTAPPPPANGYHTTHTKQANDNGLHKAVNGSAQSIELNEGSRLTPNGKSLQQLPMSDQTSSSAPDKASPADQPVQQTYNSSSPVESLLLPSAWQVSDSAETPPTVLPPVIPPKRRSRHNSRVMELSNSETNDERQTTLNVVTDTVPQSQVSTDGAKLADTSPVNVAQETLHQQDSNEHSRRSNAKLIRGKNVQVRRSGVSRWPSVADHNLVTNEHSPTNGRKSYEDNEQTEQLSMCDVGLLPPPPDFAD